MGCCGGVPIKTIPDTNRLKHNQIDLTSNPNKYITENKTYYKDQSPKNESKFNDNLFPNNPETLFGKINGKYIDENIERRNLNLKKMNFTENDIEYRRAREIWGKNCRIFNSNIKLNDIKIGSCTNTYFISALSSMIQFPQLILQLFKTLNLPEEEKEIEIGMKIEGQWKLICINDYFPVFKQTGKPVFSDAPNKAIWGVLLEKAWAKINGGYCNIINGNTKEVFETLTPFTTVEINIIKYNNYDKLWKNIIDANEYNCIMTCNVKDNINNDNNGFIPGYYFSFISSFEKNIKGENVKLIKLRNPFEEGKWNGDWSDNSGRWNENNKKIFNYDDNKNNEGYFYISYEDFMKYFDNVTFCVPLKPLKYTNFKISKDNAKLFNVVKINVFSKGIVTFTINKKSESFHKKILPGKVPNENIILVKINGKNLNYIDGSFNLPLSTNLSRGEYICIYYLDYESIGDTVKKYNFSISSCVDFQIKQCNPDKDLNLLKYILLQNVENIPKYNNRLKNPFVIFTGNHFLNNSISFIYMKNQSEEDIHFTFNTDLNNLRSLEGKIPSCILLKKNEKIIFVGIKINNNEKSHCGVNGTSTEKASKGEISPKLNQSIIDDYLSETQYEKLNVTFEFDQL